MKVIETLEMMGNRLQIAIVVCDYPQDKSGDLTIRYANNPATQLFGYQHLEMNGLDVRKLMPTDIAKSHRTYVNNYKDSTESAAGHRSSGIMGNWRCLEGVKKSGDLIPLKANVADIKNSEERYFVAIFADRTDEVAREEELKKILEKNQKVIDQLEELRKKSEEERERAESALLQEKKLTGQITLLRQIFTGTVGLITMLGLLIITSWVTGNNDAKDSLAMIERVLLVLTGILGSAMASVFDSRNVEKK